MSSRPSLPMGIKEIEALIPHRFPFLLVDRVIDYQPGVSIIGIKNVTFGEYFLQGHFPANPVMPGVLQIEAVAQTSAIFGRLEKPDSKAVLLTEVTDTRFRRQVIPGDTMQLRVKVEKRRQSFFWFTGEVWVGEEIAANIHFSAKLE